MSLPQIKTASVITSKTFPLLRDTLTAYISEAKFMPKGFFILFFSSLAAKCCINSVAEMLTHQTLLVRNDCVLSNRDCFLFWEFRCLFCDKFQVLWPPKIFYSYLNLNCNHRFRPNGYPFKPSHVWCDMVLLLPLLLLSLLSMFNISVVELNYLLWGFFTKFPHLIAGSQVLLSIHLRRDICFKGPQLSRHTFFNWNQFTVPSVPYIFRFHWNHRISAGSWKQRQN